MGAGFGAQEEPPDTSTPAVASNDRTLHVLRVFCDEEERGGNPLGVYLDEPAVPRTQRQGIARELGFSETVFVDDAAAGRLEIYTPTQELPFAGHPLVGAAWLLGRRDSGLRTLHPPAGEVSFRSEGALTWVRARPEYSPPWDRAELADAEAVVVLDRAPQDHGHIQAWAWEDERAGRIRARVFAEDYGVPEDPATGSAAIALCAALRRELLITQGPLGARSEIHVRPSEEGWIELGGRVGVLRSPRALRT